MKLIIQIPCFNEEKTLPVTYRDLPKKIDGIDTIETLIINDGSTDNTAEIAKSIGINHIINFKRNKGLAKVFSTGIEQCLKLGADIIVNTDGDNQYNGQDIKKLVEPIIMHKADIVIGDRQTDKIKHFSKSKKILQGLGSYIVRKLSNTDVKDTVSGFRAYSREAAMRINIHTDFSYTIENIIQLGIQKYKIVSVPIQTNDKLRTSRLFKNIFSFISNQLSTIIRAYATYKALKVFSSLGFLLMLPGIIGFFRFLYFYFTDGGIGHVQSVVFSAVFLIVGFITLLFGIIADLISNNRKLSEEALYRIKKLEIELNKNNEDGNKNRE